MEIRHFLRFVGSATEYNYSLFFNNLMHKFFILLHLLHSSTCFEHYYAHLQNDNFINTSGTVTLSLCVCSVHRLREESVYCTSVPNSHPKRVTVPDAVLIQLS